MGLLYEDRMSISLATCGWVLLVGVVDICGRFMMVLSVS